MFENGNCPFSVKFLAEDGVKLEPFSAASAMELENPAVKFDVRPFDVNVEWIGIHYWHSAFRVLAAISASFAGVPTWRAAGCGE